MPGCFNLSPISTVHPTLGPDAAVGRGHRPGFVHIAPQHHLTAITKVGGAGVNLAVGAEEN